MPRSLTNAAALILLAGLTGCGPSYSPNTYSAAAVQQASKVERGVIVGVRRVGVSADSTVGTVTGGAAGGIVGSQAGPGGAITALSTLGGTVVGGLIGNSVEHATGDTSAFEYIVRETNKSLVSVTQKDKVPMEIGQTVLVIAGKQARIVPDYTVQVPNELAATALKVKAKPQAPPETVPTNSTASADPASRAAASSAAPAATPGGGAPAKPAAVSATTSNGPAETATSSTATSTVAPPPLPPPLGDTAPPQSGSSDTAAPPPVPDSAQPSHP